MLASSACSGPDARIVEPGRHRVRFLDLAVLVLQQQRVAALQHARRAVRERRGVLAEARPDAAGLDAEQLDAGVAARTDGTGRSRSSRRRRRRRRRPAARPPASSICARASTPITRLELAHQVRIRMRADGRAEQVDTCRSGPTPSRAAPRRWRRAASCRRRSRARPRRRAASCGRRSAPGAPCRSRPCRPCTAGRGARRRRPIATPCWPAPVSATMRFAPSRFASSAWPIALLILCAPVCARSSRFSQTSAPQRRDSSRAYVSGVGRPTQVRSSHVELGLEAGIRQDVAHALLEPIERRHQRLGHVAPAERAEAAARVRELAAAASAPAALRGRSSGPRSLIAAILLEHDRRDPRMRRARRAARNSRISAASLTPRLDSTPELTSTPNGRTRRDRVGDVARHRARRRARARQRARARAASSQSARSPAPLRALSSRNRARQSCGDGNAPVRCDSTGSTRWPAGSRSAARSSASVCTQSGRTARSRRRLAPASDAGTPRPARRPAGTAAASARRAARPTDCAARPRGTRSRPHPRRRATAAVDAPRAFACRRP